MTTVNTVFAANRKGTRCKSNQQPESVGINTFLDRFFEVESCWRQRELKRPAAADEVRSPCPGIGVVVAVRFGNRSGSASRNYRRYPTTQW